MADMAEVAEVADRHQLVVEQNQVVVQNQVVAVVVPFFPLWYLNPYLKYIVSII